MIPIGVFGLALGVLALTAVGSGIWLVIRARDIARIADTPSSEVEAGPGRRPASSRGLVRAILVVNVVATVGALGLLILVATGVIGSDVTQTDPHAQRP